MQEGVPTSWVAFSDELEVLVGEIAARVQRWTSQGGWVFSPGSAAAAEVANTEVRLDGSPWGERPVRTVYAYAQMEPRWRWRWRGAPRCSSARHGSRRGSR